MIGNVLRYSVRKPKADLFLKVIGTVTKSEVEAWLTGYSISQFSQTNDIVKCKIEVINATSQNSDAPVLEKITDFAILNKDASIIDMDGAGHIRNFNSYYSEQTNIQGNENLAFRSTGLKNFFSKSSTVNDKTSMFNQNPNGKNIIFSELTQLTNGSSFQFRATNCNIFAAPKADLSANTQGIDSTNGDTFVTKGIYETVPAGQNQQLDYIRANFTNVIYNQPASVNASTISATTNIGGTYVELNVSQPTHVNDLKYALVFVDGFFQNVYDINNVYATNLQEQTSYNIKVIIADEYFNISPYSNTLNITTTTTPALFQNAVAYYKLDETSGNAIDVVNAYNGTLFGGVTQGVAGKIGTAYSFDGTGFVNIGQPSNFDLDPQSNFTLRAWIKTTDSNGTIICRGDAGNRQYHLFVQNSFISANIGGSGNNNTEVSVNNGNWNHVVLVNNNGIYSFYVNGVKTNQDYSAGTTTISVDTLIGSRRASSNTGSGFPFTGEIDELTPIKDEAWDLGKISDDYNNGNGTTI